jgi:hypothetical protein
MWCFAKVEVERDAKRSLLYCSPSRDSSSQGSPLHLEEEKGAIRGLERKGG